MLKFHKHLIFQALVSIFFLIFFQPVYAQKEKNQDSFTSFLQSFSPILDFEMRSSYHSKKSNLNPNEFWSTGSITAGLSKELIPGLLLSVSPKLNFDSQFSKGVYPIIEDRSYRPAATFKEALVSWYGDTFEIEVGKKIFSWQIADSSSPLDTLNPSDVIDPIASKKIGVPSISILKMFEAASVQLVYLPIFIPDRKPDESSRWSTDNPEGRAAFINKFGFAPVNKDLGRALPDRFDKSSIAARITSSTLITGWDLAFVYRFGYSSKGVIRNDINLASLPTVFQTTEYPSFHLYGFSFSTTFKEIEFHGEAAYHDTRDNLKDEDYLSWIAGINYTSYSIFPDLFDETLFILEYAGETVIEERDSGSTYSNAGITRGVTTDIIAAVELQINEDHCIKTYYVYNTANEDSLMDVSLESVLNDNLEITLGYQRLSGEENSFFGQWNENDRYYFKLSYKY